MSENHFQDVFFALKGLMKDVAEGLVVKADSGDGLMLVGPRPDIKGRELYFGSVQIKKNYVSFYLMPVYMNPGLLADLSPELRKRMQGKSCFNFKQIDESLFAELRDLTQKGHAWFVENAETFAY